MDSTKTERRAVEMKWLKKLFNVKLSADEVVYLTLVQIRAM